MELQINRPETRIEKMQEMFNRDLEEIMKNQSIMNNELTEIKSTLEGTNRRIGVPEEEKKKGHEKILEEIIVENFPKTGKELTTQVQETQRVPNRINPRQNTPRHILIKLMKIKHKEQILKATWKSNK